MAKVNPANSIQFKTVYMISKVISTDEYTHYYTSNMVFDSLEGILDIVKGSFVPIPIKMYRENASTHWKLVPQVGFSLSEELGD